MQEYDPTATDPEEPPRQGSPLGDEEKPPKPAIEDMPSEEGVEPPSDDEEEDVHDDEFLDDQEAAGDDTIDNEEQQMPKRDEPERETDSEVQKPPLTEDQRQGDPADEPVVPFQPNPEPAPTSAPENPPQPPEYDPDELNSEEDDDDEDQ